MRQATRDDLPGIWRVRYAVVENTLAPGRIEDDEVIAQLETTGRGWVVEECGEIVAFALGDAKGANVWALFVDPRVEGRGHGSRLHDTMVQWLWTHGLDTLWLGTGTVAVAVAVAVAHPGARPLRTPWLAVQWPGRGRPGPARADQRRVLSGRQWLFLRPAAVGAAKR